MRKTQVIELVKDELESLAVEEQSRVARINRIIAGSTVKTDLERLRAQNPKRREKQELLELSHTPLIELIIRTVVQQMDADGVTTGDDTAARVWRPWEVNGFPSRQHALFEGPLKFGYSFVLVTPGEIAGTPAAVLKPLSPSRLAVVEGDEDAEFPMFALRTIHQANGDTLYRLYDDESIYFLAKARGSSKLEFVEERAHNIGVCPVVWFGDRDIDGETKSEPEKYAVVANRFVKTTYDRLLAQHYNSWRVRTATGLEDPGSVEEEARVKTTLAQDDILVGGPGVQFGTLPETNLDGLLRAAEADRDTLAAVSQTPVWALNGGQLVNLSPDALVESRSMNKAKVNLVKRVFGRSIAQMLRLAAHVEGRAEDAANFNLRVVWADTEPRSLSQSADALGKLASQLQVPVEKLWEMIPGVSNAKVSEWQKWRESHPDETSALVDALRAGRGTD